MTTSNNKQQSCEDWIALVISVEKVYNNNKFGKED